MIVRQSLLPKRFLGVAWLFAIFATTSGIGFAQTPKIGLELVAEGLTSPTMLVPAPDDSGKLFVLDQVGVIKIIGADGQLVEKPFLDLRDELANLE